MRNITRRQLFNPNDKINVVSLLVSAKPKELINVENKIKNEIEYAEVEHVEKNGKIIVTLETKTEQQIVSAIDGIQDINGVVSVALVFHHTEDKVAS